MATSAENRRRAFTLFTAAYDNVRRVTTFCDGMKPRVAFEPGELVGEEGTRVPSILALDTATLCGQSRSHARVRSTGSVTVACAHRECGRR